MEDDYSAFIGHNKPDDMGELATLAEQQHAKEIEIETIENKLKVAKEELREISEKKIPEKMDSLNLSSYMTTSGLEISVKETIRASLSVENRPKGYDWLEKEGCGGLIKSQVVAAYGRDEIAEAHELVEELKKRNRIAALERKVEPMTLVAFVRERLAQGKDIPADIFGILRQRVSKVEVAGTKKSRKSVV